MFIQRELNKSFAAFSSHTNLSISTGSWGCGIYAGDKQLKCILQWCAASAAAAQQKVEKVNVDQVHTLQYYTFGDVQLTNQIQDFCAAISNNKCTVKQVMEVLVNAENMHEVVEQKSAFLFVAKSLGIAVKEDFY